MKRSALVVAALVLAGDSGGCGGGGAAVRDGGGPVHPGDELVLGAALPAGQLARIGRLRLAHPATESAVSDVAVADGGALVSSNGWRVRVWDPATGALLWQALQLDCTVRFSLSRDGKRIAVAYTQSTERSGHVEIYELGGRRLLRIETGLASATAFSPDGTKLVVAHGETEIFAVADGRRLGTWKHDPWLLGFAGEREVIAVGPEGTRRWRWEDGKVEEEVRFTGRPTAVALAPDASAMAWASGAAVHVVRLDGAGAARAASELVAPAPVNGLALSRRGAEVAAGWEGGVALWSLGGPGSPGGVAQQRWQLGARAKTYSTALAFSADGQTLAASALGLLSTIDVARGAYAQEPGAPLVFHDFAADGGVLLARGEALEHLDLKSGARTPANQGHGGAPIESGLAFTDGELQEVREVASKRVRWSRSMPARPLVTAAFSANRRWLVVVQGAPDPQIAIDAALREARGGAEADEGKDEEDSHVYHLDEDEYDPPAARFAVEIFDLSKAAPAGPEGGEALALELLWNGAGELAGAAILDDGTVFVGRNDGGVLAARITDSELSDVARLGAGVRELRVAPSGAVVAVTDGDDQTLLLTAGALKAGSQ